MIGNIMFLAPDSPVPMIAVQTALNLHRYPRIPTFVKDFVKSYRLLYWDALARISNHSGLRDFCSRSASASM